MLPHLCSCSPLLGVLVPGRGRFPALMLIFRLNNGETVEIDAPRNILDFCG